MRKRVLAVAAACVVALALGGSLAWAAATASLNIPFSFFVKDKEMPAGRYVIETVGNDLTKLTVKGAGGSVIATVLERLADTGAKEPKVVFDKVEGKYYLSEVHYPGMDGFLVGIAKGKETHEVITGKE
ncbi:MAG TPA: hypothetical protein VMT45_03030 [Thermoanaerobaculaceae bacterium]|nr:hypothetical protein [Thermoanaerobaculaceae bacterium]